MTRKTMLIEHEGMTIRVCYNERTAKTWKCSDCGKARNPKDCEVCQRCGFMRDGCAICHSDMRPATRDDGTELYPFIPGVKLIHKCVKPGCTGIAVK